MGLGLFFDPLFRVPLVAGLLIAADTPLGAATGQALIDGQLYLAAPAQLAAVVLLWGLPSWRSRGGCRA